MTGRRDNQLRYRAKQHLQLKPYGAVFENTVTYFSYVSVPSKLHIKLNESDVLSRISCHFFSRIACNSCTAALLLLNKLLDLLVPVSSTYLYAFTSGLSPCRLQGVLLLSDGISLLEVGFTLRCLQRLSLPDLATLL